MTDPTTKPTWEPPYMTGEQIYPDDPAAAQALEDARNQRTVQVTTSEPPNPAVPVGLTPNQVLHWSGMQTGSPPPVQQAPPTEPPVEPPPAG